MSEATDLKDACWLELKAFDANGDAVWTHYFDDWAALLAWADAKNEEAPR